MEKLFVRFASLTAKVAGKSWTFIACLGIVLIWAVTGPIFGFSQTWQLVINTGTTIVTFLMVFLLQNTGNRTIEQLQDRLREVEAINREVLAELRALRAERQGTPRAVLREVA
jgi:low affinity Fe/Cu permease